ncbi:kinase D interacting substrate 220 [Phyllostomus discolor]|uniref:Kinase D interacting substrate 220 n=1 Tax=Phyllostomus discolor TaxID=89673 RepID=A0A834A6U2_9CHIR|nr:kinase D interacting substrate 220 [Phyllostomus discolor]
MSVLISQSVINYVEEENIPALKALLEKCKDVDERNECGQTPLMIAAEQGSLEIVKELVKNGANCNLEDLDNWTALISASKEGHVHVVEELLRCGADVEHRDMGGWTALMWACYKGRTEVVELLLSHGANPSVTGLQHSVYPIIWAAGRGHADIVRLLLQNGAKVNCSDKVGPDGAPRCALGHVFAYISRGCQDVPSSDAYQDTLYGYTPHRRSLPLLSCHGHHPQEDRRGTRRLHCLDFSLQLFFLTLVPSAFRVIARMIFLKFELSLSYAQRPGDTKPRMPCEGGPCLPSCPFSRPLHPTRPCEPYLTRAACWNVA